MKEFGCIVCGKQVAPFFQAGAYRMYRCEVCSHAFVYPTPSDQFLIEFYSTFHTALEMGGGYELIEDRTEKDFSSKIHLIKTHLTKPSPVILDFGCGKGFFVKALINEGIQAEGIDLSDTAVRFACNNLNVPAICGLVDDCEWMKDRFDGVSFWATIEHLPRPIETLKSIAAVIKTGGYLFLDTGIGDDWLDRMLPGVNQWYDPPQHLHVFSIRSIVKLLEEAGFSVVKIDPMFERSVLRRVARLIRGSLASFGFRVVAEMTRSVNRPKHNFGFTRFPLGNLMSIVALKN